MREVYKKTFDIHIFVALFPFFVMGLNASISHSAFPRFSSSLCFEVPDLSEIYISDRGIWDL